MVRLHSVNSGLVLVKEVCPPLTGSCSAYCYSKREREAIFARPDKLLTAQENSASLVRVALYISKTFKSSILLALQAAITVRLWRVGSDPVLTAK